MLLSSVRYALHLGLEPKIKVVEEYFSTIKLQWHGYGYRKTSDSSCRIVYSTVQQLLVA